MNTTHVLQTHQLKKYFGSIHAVEDISLSVKHGEIFGFLGPNGAGKTTTISMILGLTYPTAGEVEIFGERVTPQHNQILRRVGTLVGTSALMLAFSAHRNLQTLSYLYPDLPAKRIDQVLEQVGLSTVGNRPVSKFSTGMKQRMGLALALLKQPDLLILDEPTNDMDPAGMQEIRLLLRSLAEQDTTIFLSSHLLHEMELLCDRVAVIQKGKVLARDLHDSVKQHIFIAALQVGAAKIQLGEREGAIQQRLTEAEDILQQVQQELARLIHELRPVVLKEQGFTTALQALAAQWSRQTGIAASIQIEGDSEQALSPLTEEALFRVTQEALSNVIRHSQASSVYIHLVYKPDKVTLSITDNGQGFNSTLAKSRGVGFASMHERIAAVGGEMHVESTIGSGTSIIVQYERQHMII